MKVLIAIDDSKFSQAAIDTFIAQANPKETEVRFLHVLEPIYTHGQTLGYFPDASRILAEESENAKALLARASQKLGDEGFTVTTALEVGNPKVVIIDSAAEWHADLICGGLTRAQRARSFLTRERFRGCCTPCELLGADRACSHGGAHASRSQLERER